MLGIAEGILQDLHDDHAAVASLIDDIADSNDASERNRLFQEMRSKLLTHSHAEEQVLYRRPRHLNAKPIGALLKRAKARIS